MQPGGQYGEVPPQYARAQGGGSSAGAATNPNSTHAHLFNLSHDVAAAAAGGGLGLSSNSPSLSHSAGHPHHPAHSFSLHHHPLPASVPAPSYLHFQDHLSSHHHHPQNVQSSSASHNNPPPTVLQQQLDHSTSAPSSSSAGLHIHQQPHKQGMVPSISITVHAGPESTPLQQSTISQPQYTQQQQQQHNLGLGLESPKSSLSSLQQVLASRSSALQQQPSSTPTPNIITSTVASAMPSTPMITSSTASAAPLGDSVQGQPGAAAASASLLNSTTAAVEPGVAMNLQQIASIKGMQGAAMADQAGLQDMEGDGLGDEGEKGSGGNRWPRQETLALLKVRSEMDASFRDSSLKRPLWDEVSRKLAELGYQRSAKKCKEKFENVHKYYKRTKEGRAGRQDGKNYRFFSELEALYGNAGHSSSTSITVNANTSLPSASIFSLNPIRPGLLNDASPGTNQARGDLGRSPTSFLLGSSLAVPTRLPDLSTQPVNPAPFHLRSLNADHTSGLSFSSDTSSSDDVDDDDEYEDPPDAAPADHSKKRKRKSASRMMAFFESLLKQVIEKQEQMQQRFLDALERREQDRMIREEAWKRQEMARMNREHDLHAQERSLAATRDAAIVAFIQKVTGQTFQLPTTSALAIAVQPVQSHAPAPMSSKPALDPAYHHIPEDQDPFDSTSKRWPKPEVLALIKLRTSLHSRFTEPGPKGPLWEEISDGMSFLGYNRNAKRCKEKWENINKYFKKAKESNKNRPENAKTCPYYHQLDALYKQGVLGSGNISSTIIKALPHKLSSDNLDGNNNNPSQVIQASLTHSREGELVGHGSTSADRVLAIMPPASDATAPTGNANVTLGTHVFSVNNPDARELMSKEVLNPHPGNDLLGVEKAVDMNADTKPVMENPSRIELSEELAGRSSLQMAQRGVNEAQPHRNMSNQGYEHKVDLEQEARLVEEEAHQQQKQHVFLAQRQVAHQAPQLQYQHMEGVTSGSAQQSSFIANVLQRFSTDAAESNTSTTSTTQEN